MSLETCLSFMYLAVNRTSVISHLIEKNLDQKIQNVMRNKLL